MLYVACWVHWREWLLGFEPHILSVLLLCQGNRRVNKMKNRFRKTECKSVYAYEMCDCRQNNYISLLSSENHRRILPFLRWIWFLKVCLWGRMEKSIQPRSNLCCDLSVAPHEGRLATESGTFPLCRRPDQVHICLNRKHKNIDGSCTFYSLGAL